MNAADGWMVHQVDGASGGTGGQVLSGTGALVVHEDSMDGRTVQMVQVD